MASVGEITVDNIGVNTMFTMGGIAEIVRSIAVAFVAIVHFTMNLSMNAHKCANCDKEASHIFTFYLILLLIESIGIS